MFCLSSLSLILSYSVLSRPIVSNVVLSSLLLSYIVFVSLLAGFVWVARTPRARRRGPSARRRPTRRETTRGPPCPAESNWNPHAAGGPWSGGLPLKTRQEQWSEPARGAFCGLSQDWKGGARVLREFVVGMDGVWFWDLSETWVGGTLQDPTNQRTP